MSFLPSTISALPYKGDGEKVCNINYPIQHPTEGDYAAVFVVEVEATGNTFYACPMCLLEWQHEIKCAVCNMEMGYTLLVDSPVNGVCEDCLQDLKTQRPNDMKTLKKHWMKQTPVNDSS